MPTRLRFELGTSSPSRRDGFVIALVGTFAGAAIGGAFGHSNAGIVLGLVPGAAFFLFFLLKPFQAIRRTFKLRSALDRLDSTPIQSGRSDHAEGPVHSGA